MTRITLEPIVGQLERRQDYHFPGPLLLDHSTSQTILLCYFTILLLVVIGGLLHSTYCSYPLFHRDLSNLIFGQRPQRNHHIPIRSLRRHLHTKSRHWPFTPVSSSPARDEYLTLAQRESAV
jgi:hypothetical protein